MDAVPDLLAWPSSTPRPGTVSKEREIVVLWSRHPPFHSWPISAGWAAATDNRRGSTAAGRFGRSMEGSPVGCAPRKQSGLHQRPGSRASPGAVDRGGRAVARRGNRPESGGGEPFIHRSYSTSWDTPPERIWNRLMFWSDESGRVDGQIGQSRKFPRGGRRNGTMR